MKINTYRLFTSLVLTALGAGVVKICFHIGFILIPLLLFVSAFFIYLYKADKALSLMFFILPFGSSLPWFDCSSVAQFYPYNYLSTLLFYAGGMFVASLFKREKSEERAFFFKAYNIFLFLVFLSALFVFARWSGLTNESVSSFENFQVTLAGMRVSFAGIFPVVSLMLAAVPPSLFILMRINRYPLRSVVLYLCSGMWVSLIISLVQKYWSRTFMDLGDHLKKSQVSGGASDFNGFGMVFGFIFLVIVIYFLDVVKKSRKSKYELPFLLFSASGTLLGIMLSGSRTALFFMITAIILTLLSDLLSSGIKSGFVFIIVLVALLFGSVMYKRVSQKYEYMKDSLAKGALTEALDRGSNGRVTMIKNSAEILGLYPLSGTGTGNFIPYLIKMKAGEKYLHDLPLNQFLLIADENGLPVLAIYIIFLFFLIKNRVKGNYKYPFLILLLSFLVHNPLWFPEVTLLFWVSVYMLYDKENGEQKLVYKRGWGLLLLLLSLVSLTAQFVSHNSLEPLVWAEKTGAEYTYNLWKERDGSGREFFWTSEKSGLLLSRESRSLLVKSGLPKGISGPDRQSVKVFLKGRLYRSFILERSSQRKIALPSDFTGIADIIVNPCFLPRSGDSRKDTRHLGVMIYR